MRLLIPILVALPLAATAQPTELERDVLGPHWSGIQYQDTLGWTSAAADVTDDGRVDLLVSAPQEAGPLSFDSAVYVFEGRDERAPVNGRADWFFTRMSDGKTGGDEVFEFHVGAELTGDGRPDVLIAEPNAGEAGKVLLHAGQGGSWAELLSSEDAVARWFGANDGVPNRPSLVGAGDFDGDGDADIVVASGLAGRVWLDWNEGSGFSGNKDLDDLGDTGTQCEDEAVTAEFAKAMVVGDWNADDIDDLAIAAPGCEGGEGRVFVWYGGPNIDLRAADLVLDGGDRLGTALNRGDANGDGIDDLLVQEALTGVAEDAGQLRMHFGRPGGLASAPDSVISPGVLDRRFGESVVVHPDLSSPADGLPDLVVGSPGAAGSGEGQGAIYVFENPGTWPAAFDPDAASYKAVGTGLGAWFGHSLTLVPDFDGDGHWEVLVGEPNYTEGDSENDARRGRIYLFNALPDRDEDGDGVTTLLGDCDDRDDAVGPNQVEVCFDEVDNDCDQVVDENCDEGDDDDAAGDDDDDDDDSSEPNDGCDCSTADGSAGLLSLLPLLSLALQRRRRIA